MKMHSIVLGSATIVLGMGMSGGAQALTATGRFFQNAAGFCTPALPAFEGTIRKRPTAVSNEGTTNSFVSCSGQTSAESTTGVTSMNLLLHNNTAASINVTCSLVNSYQAGGTIVPKTTTIGANGAAFVTWTPADIGNPPSMQWANFSCNLPVGTDIGYLYYFYTYDIGA